MTEEWDVAAGAGVLASAGVVVSVTAAAMAAAKVSAVRDILIFIEVMLPFCEVDHESCGARKLGFML
jgi:hypothetical protein